MPIFTKNKFDLITPTNVECEQMYNTAVAMEDLAKGSYSTFERLHSEGNRSFFNRYSLHLMAIHSKLLGYRAGIESVFLYRIHALKCIDIKPCADDMLLLAALKKKEEGDTSLETAMEILYGNFFQLFFMGGLSQVRSLLKGSWNSYKSAAVYLKRQMEHCDMSSDGFGDEDIEIHLDSK